VESTLVDNATKLKFTYDYIGRRIQKQVYAWDAASDLRYVYDGWNLIEILDATDTNSVARTYTWGLDLSQSLQGAGGVGGLLAVTEHGETADTPYYNTYDANGNISEYLDNTGSVAVHYEYSPFGKLTTSAGAKASDFDHRFSTKFLDTASGTYYYGFRYYSPELGRWLSRDPLGELFGEELTKFELSPLYIFSLNQPTTAVDIIGLASKSLSDHAYEKMIDLYKNHKHEVGRKYQGACPQGAEKTDCITYCLNVLEYAYEMVGRKDVADTIRKKGKRGTDLAAYLKTLGWKAIYWNPDTRNPRDYSASTTDWYEHTYSYYVAKKKETYYQIPITALVVDYYPTDSQKHKLRNEPKTTRKMKEFAKLVKVKFGYGLARGGYHTFLYGLGFVYEVHWDQIGDDLYEKSPFVSYEWLSGAILVPPDNGVF